MNTNEEMLKSERFRQQMLIEIQNNNWKNNGKGAFLDWDNIDTMIHELEYHKAKMMIALKQGQRDAVKEYIADTANILFAIGNLLKLYDEDSVNDQMGHELNKTNLISKVDLADVKERFQQFSLYLGHY